MINNQKYRYGLPVVFWMMVIFWMSTGTFSSENTSLIIEPMLHFFMPGLSHLTIDIIHGFIRKCAHIGEYFILGFLLFRFFRGNAATPGVLKWTTSAMIVLTLYAASDEFHQSFVATRTASVIDVGFDMAGGLLAQLVFGFWHLLRQKQATGSKQL